MADRMIELGEGFWNVRGSFKFAGMVDIGTQTSLVRLKSGQFVLLDAYEPDEAVMRQIMALTDEGRAIEAIINLHPFHTIHVEAMANHLPHAKLYGTARHVARAPGLTWQPELVESEAFPPLYADDLVFSLPAGVELIPENEHLHFASILAYHPASKTLHVDDTLSWVDAPLIGGLAFHFTLKKVLYKRPGAAAAFRAWAEELITLCEDVEHLCTAHSRPLPPSPSSGGPAIATMVRQAYAKQDKMLAAHERKFG